MTIKVTNDCGKYNIELSGRLDSTTSGELEEKMNEIFKNDVETLTIDLGEVDFISSKGLRVLVGAYKTMDGREMVLTNANESILDVLQMSGLLKIFTVK